MKKDTVDNVRRLKDAISLHLGIGALMLFLFCAIPAAYGQDIQAQNQPVGGNVQVGDNAGNVPVEEAQNNAGYQQAGQQQMDVQGDGVQELTETIPPAVAIPDADWIFEVPVDVQGLSPEVKRIQIYASVSKVGEGIFGFAHKKLELRDGAYQGDVLIGVRKKPEYSYQEASVADRYRIYIRLCPDPECQENRWPTIRQNELPAYIRMNPDRPFRYDIWGDLY